MTAVSALSLLLAAAVLSRPGARLRRSSEVRAPASTVALLPVAVTSSPALLAGQGAAPTLLPAAAPRGHSRVAAKSLKSCYSLYFRRRYPYQKRHQKNINRRAYNIYHTNRYKKLFSRLNKQTRMIGSGEEEERRKIKFESMADVVAYMKDRLDMAFRVIDECTIQGVCRPKEAIKRKEWMCRLLVVACYMRGFFEEKPSVYQAQYKLLGYEPPKVRMLREPRPWQLPGWKSPWMLKREFMKWQVWQEALETEEAEAAKAAAEAQEVEA